MYVCCVFVCMCVYACAGVGSVQRDFVTNGVRSDCMFTAGVSSRLPHLILVRQCFVYGARGFSCEQSLEGEGVGDLN